MAVRGCSALLLLLSLAACGRSPNTPSAAPGPSPSPVSVHPVTGFTFYDEDGDGTLDPGEDTRLSGDPGHPGWCHGRVRR